MGFKSLLDRILLNFIIAGKNKVLVEIGTDCILPYNTAITKYPTTIASKKKLWGDHSLQWKTLCYLSQTVFLSTASRKRVLRTKIVWSTPQGKTLFQSGSCLKRIVQFAPIFTSKRHSTSIAVNRKRISFQCKVCLAQFLYTCRDDCKKSSSGWRASLKNAFA